MRSDNRTRPLRRRILLTMEQLEARELLTATTVDVGLGSIMEGGNADTPAAPTFRNGSFTYGVPSSKSGMTYTPILPAANEGTSFNQIPQTNDWWSSLFWRQQGTSVTPPDVNPAPFAVQFLTSAQTAQPGLIVGFPSQVAIDWLGQVDSGGNLNIRETVYRYPLSYTPSPGSANPGFYGHTASAFNLGNFSVSIAGAALTDPTQIKVEGYSDWAVTASWGTSGSRQNVTMGQGLPFLYFNPGQQTAPQVQFTYTNLPASTAVDFHNNNDGTAYFGVPTAVQPGVNRMVYYGIFGMTGASIASTATEITITPDATDPYFSVALLPPAFQPMTNAAASTTIFNQFKSTAYAEVTNTQVSYDYQTATNQVVTTLGAMPQSGITFHHRTFTDGTQVVDTPLFALWPHQYESLNGSPLNGLFDYGAPTSTGTAGVTTATTLQDTSQNWTPSQFVGATVVITSGASAGVSAQITSNTSNQLTFTAWSGNLPAGTYSYQVLTPLSRGLMKLLVATTNVGGTQLTGFQTTLDHRSGLLPFLPPGGALTVDSGTLNNQNSGARLKLSLVQEIENIAFASPPAIGDQGDSYGVGKLLLRFANLIPLADQLSTDPGVSASDQVNMALARDKLINLVQDELVRWFQASQLYQFLYYNKDWNTLIGYQASFGTDTDLNDHHFHYGYFLHAAGILAQYNPQFLAEGGTDNFGGILKLLARDVANWERQSPSPNGMVFPFLRFFNPYLGHSYASGHGFFSDGNNQESSSESVNFSAGLALLGEAFMNLGDADGQKMRDLGVALYETEIRSIEQYTFDIDDQVFPFGFNNYDPTAFNGSFPAGVITPAVGNGMPLTQTAQQWDSGGQNALFFNSNFAEAPFSIDWLPISGSSLYLGRHPTYVQKNWAFYEQNITNFANDPTFSALFPYPIYPGADWSYQALDDPGASGTDSTPATGALANYLKYYKASPPAINNGFDIGESSAMTFRWITTLAQYGEVDNAIMATTTSATGLSHWAAFKNGSGVVTYVAYNPSSSPMTVTFTDSSNPANDTTLTNIPARSMAYKTGPGGTQMTHALPPVPIPPAPTPPTPLVTYYLSNTDGGITAGTLSTTPGDRNAATTLVTMPANAQQTNAIPPSTATNVARFTLSGVTTTGTVPTNVTGSATGGTATSLTVSGTPYTANQFAGYLVFLSGGTGQGQWRIVGANTASTLFVTKAWQTNPDGSTQFTLYPITQLSLWLHDNGFSATQNPSGTQNVVGVGVRYKFNGGPPSDDSQWDRQELFIPSGGSAPGAPLAAETSVAFGYDLWNLYNSPRVDGLNLFGFPFAGGDWQQFNGGTIQLTVWAQNNGSTHAVDLSANSVGPLGRQSTLSLPAGFTLQAVFARSTLLAAPASVTNVPPVVTVQVYGIPQTGLPLLLHATVRERSQRERRRFRWTVVEARTGRIVAGGTGRDLLFVPRRGGRYTATVMVTDDGGGVRASRDITVIPSLFGL